MLLWAMKELERLVRELMRVAITTSPWGGLVAASKDGLQEASGAQYSSQRFDSKANPPDK